MRRLSLALLAAATLAFSAWRFITVDRLSHSASDTLINVVPPVALAWALVAWVARRTRPRGA